MALKAGRHIAVMHFDHYAIRLLTEDDLHAYYRLTDRNRSRLKDFFAGTVAIPKRLRLAKRT